MARIPTTVKTNPQKKRSEMIAAFVLESPVPGRFVFTGFDVGEGLKALRV
jgi:hypothetical protein